MLTLRKRSSANSQVVNCQPEDGVNDAVRIVGVEGNTITVQKVNPYNRTQMPAYGVILQKYSPTKCLVQTSGSLSLTNSGSLTPGKACFVGANGKLSTTPPPVDETISSYVIIQTMGLAETPARLDFRPDLQTLEVVA